MANAVNLSKKKYGRWIVLKFGGLLRGNRVWKCRCECGTARLVEGYRLRNGVSKSCGCITLESITTHAMSRSPEWKAWIAMKARCLNPSDSRFKNYGGRGIGICKKWVNSFESFFSDMGERPSAVHSLERIRNDCGYSPSNCKWATRSEQSKNTRRTLFFKHNGTEMCLKDWSRKTGIAYSTLRKRLKLGWSFHHVISKSVDMRFSTR